MPVQAAAACHTRLSRWLCLAELKVARRPVTRRASPTRGSPRCKATFSERLPQSAHPPRGVQGPDSGRDVLRRRRRSPRSARCRPGERTRETDGEEPCAAVHRVCVTIPPGPRSTPEPRRTSPSKPTAPRHHHDDATGTASWRRSSVDHRGLQSARRRQVENSSRMCRMSRDSALLSPRVATPRRLLGPTSVVPSATVGVYASSSRAARS